MLGGLAVRSIALNLGTWKLPALALNACGLVLLIPKCWSWQAFVKSVKSVVKSGATYVKTVKSVKSGQWLKIN